MIRRSPTRIELKLDDLQEFEYIKNMEKKKQPATTSGDREPPKLVNRHDRIGFRPLRAPIGGCAAMCAAAAATASATTQTPTTTPNSVIVTLPMVPPISLTVTGPLVTTPTVVTRAAASVAMRQEQQQETESPSSPDPVPVPVPVPMDHSEDSTMSDNNATTDMSISMNGTPG